ncbi:MAG: hypothetical protein FNT29_01875 [Halothiobacillaceae bacterium]|nr:MAG: hypothetical protein FNT29_01875 [Halothiobacillaceae bacterium]
MLSAFIQRPLIPLALVFGLGLASPSAAGPWATTTSTLLKQLETLHCSIESNEALQALEALCNQPLSSLGLPADRRGEDHAELHAGSLDIMLRVMDQTAERFPELGGEVERCVLSWDFCALRRERDFIDVRQDGAARSTCPPAGPYPAQGVGLRRWGFDRKDPPDRRVPRLLLNSGLGHAEHTLLLHRIHRLQCFPHPRTGLLPDEEARDTPYGPNRHATERLDWTGCETTYPFGWSPRCELDAGYRAGFATGYRGGFTAGLKKGQAEAIARLRRKYDARRQEGMRQGREHGLMEGRRGLASTLSADPGGMDEAAILASMAPPQEPGIMGADMKSIQAMMARAWNREAFDQAFGQGRHEGRRAGEVEGFMAGMNDTLAARLEQVGEAGFKEGVRAGYAQAWAAGRQIAMQERQEQTPPPPRPPEHHPAPAPQPPPVVPPMAQAPTESPAEQVPTVKATPMAPPVQASAAAPSGPVTPPPGPHGLSGNLFHSWKLADGEPTLGANMLWEPASYWFVRAGANLDYRDENDALSYSWGIGYDDWHPGTWSFQLNNWGPILPGEGLKPETAVFSIGYKLEHELLAGNHIAASVGLDIPMQGEKTLGTTWQWSPMPSWFVRAGLSVKEDDPSRVYWSYGFGRWDWKAFTWTLQYNNWGPNPAFTPNIKQNGAVMLGWSWAY